MYPEATPEINLRVRFTRLRGLLGNRKIRGSATLERPATGHKAFYAAFPFLGIKKQKMFLLCPEKFAKTGAQLPLEHTVYY